MIRILLFAVILLLIYWILNWFKNTPAAVVRQVLKKSGWWLVLAVLLILMLSGRLTWLLAGLGVGVAFVLRTLPVLLRYAPHLHKLWSIFQSAKTGRQQQSSAGRPGNANLSQAEALQILGLKPGATNAEIIAAHRKLISRLHPDRGGSDYLAAQINLAKQVLLGR